MSKETQEIFQRIAKLSEAGYMITFRPQWNGSILCKIQRGNTQVSGLGISLLSAFQHCEEIMSCLFHNRL